MASYPEVPHGRAGRVGALARCCHPGPTAAVTLLTGALAARGRPARRIVLLAGAVLAGQLSIGWGNDALDARRDRAVGRGRAPRGSAGVEAGRWAKPAAAGEVPAGVVGAASVVAGTVCLPLSLANGRRAGTAHLVAVAAGWAYNLGVRGTVFSPVPYAVAFGLLPSALTRSLPGQPAPAARVVCGSALLGVGVHLVDVLPDLEVDHVTGVHGLPHRLGRRRVRRVAPALLLAALVTLAAEPGWRRSRTERVLLATAVVLAATGTLPRDPHSTLPFRASVGVAALAVTVLLRQGGDLTAR